MNAVFIKMNISKFIFFQNENYFAINKFAGLSTLEDRNSETSLLQLARDSFEDARVCHRLDKDTTGAIILARNEEAYRNLSLQFQERKVSKIYHAIVQGKCDFQDFEVSIPLFITGSGRVRVDKKLGKPALTVLKTLETYKDFTLIACRPVTGKKHQIRVHLSSIGHPIVGDLIYGGKCIYLSSLKKNFNFKDGEEYPLIKRMALHAYQISFADVDGRTLTLEAEYPKDFSVVLRQLRKYGS